MTMSSSLGKPAKFAGLLGVILSGSVALNQGSATTFLRIQRSKAYLEVDSNVQHARGLYGVTFGNPGDVWHYPNSLSCLVVYGGGKYVLEKTDEPKLGRPKTKLTEGSFTADELQQLRAILDEEAVQKITSPPMPDMPADAVAVREIESLNVQIERQGGSQEFMTVKERLRTNALTGMDKWLDNGAQYQKSLAPLLNWFKDFEKKTKSGLKDAKPQYCTPMNIG